MTIYYDGSCPLCTSEISVYRKCAGAEEVAFVDVSAHESGLVAPDLDKASALKRFHVRLSDGSLVPFFTRPISMGFAAITVFTILLYVPAFKAAVQGTQGAIGSGLRSVLGRNR